MVEEFEHSPQDPAAKKRDWYSVVSVCGFIICVGVLMLLIWLPASFRVGFFGIAWFVYASAVVGIVLIIYGQAGKRKVNRQGKG